MFGGPWLGLIAFLLIAVGMGWGVAKFFELAGQAQPSAEDRLNHAFEPDTPYTLDRDLLLGYLTDGRVALYPARDDLPSQTPNRGVVPTIEQARGWTAEQRADNDLKGILRRGTAVRFVEVIEQPGNAQTRILVLIEVIDGEFAGLDKVVGMHLESVDTDPQSGEPRLIPRQDLFTNTPPEPTPVQSPAPPPDPAPDPPNTTPPAEDETDHAR